MRNNGRDAHSLQAPVHTCTHTQQYASSWVVYCLCHTILVQAHSHNRVYYKRAGRVGRIRGTKKKFVLVPKTGLWLVPMMAPLACVTVLDSPRGLRLA